MSFLVRLKTEISNLEYFKLACGKNNIEFVNMTNLEIKGMPKGTVATLIDQEKKGLNIHHGYLVKESDTYRLVMDSDARYSSLTRRLGANGGKLMRNYTEIFIEQEMALQGGSMVESIEQEDGGVLLKVTMP